MTSLDGDDEAPIDTSTGVPPFSVVLLAHTATEHRFLIGRMLLLANYLITGFTTQSHDNSCNNSAKRNVIKKAHEERKCHVQMSTLKAGTSTRMRRSTPSLSEAGKAAYRIEALAKAVLYKPTCKYPGEPYNLQEYLLNFVAYFCGFWL
jgi:hypothetical protein